MEVDIDKCFYLQLFKKENIVFHTSFNSNGDLRLYYEIFFSKTIHHFHKLHHFHNFIKTNSCGCHGTEKEQAFLTVAYENF